MASDYIQTYLYSVLKGQESSLIAEPMEKQCRVAVLAPVYEENFEVILQLLDSLAKQKNIKPKEFEMVLIINNSKKEAENKTHVFKTNQSAIKLIKFIKKLGPAPKGLQRRQLETIRNIQSSGIIIHFIDKSSAQTAYEISNVGVARNRGGAEICQRFLSVPAGEKGIIMNTDCDCALSPNFINGLKNTFDQYNVIAALGDLKFVPDPAFPDQRLLKQVTKVCGGNDVRGLPKSFLVKGKKVYFEKKDKINLSLLNSGQNIAVLAKTLALAGGFPLYPTYEDTAFGRRVSQLPGEVAKNLNLMVTTLARPSERAGVSAFGRKLKSVLASIEEFRQGRAKKIYVFHKRETEKFLYYASRLARQGQLDEKWLEDLLKAFHFRRKGLTDEHLKEIVEVFNREFKLLDSQHNFVGINDIIAKHLYHRFPQKDITAKFKDVL